MPSPNGFLLQIVLNELLNCPLHFRVNQVFKISEWSQSELKKGRDYTALPLYYITLLLVCPRNLPLDSLIKKSE